MKKILQVAAVMLVLTLPVAAQKSQSQVVVSPNSSPEADQYAHVILATQYANSTAYFNIPNGITRHALTFQTDAGVTGITVTVSASTGGSFTQVGASSVLGNTITWSGTYSQARVVVTGFTGSGAVDADYRGSAPPAVMVPTPNPLYSTPYGAPIATMSTTSGTVVTASTVLVGTAIFTNVTTGAVTVNLTNTAGTSVLTAFSIPANSNLIMNFVSGLQMVGIKAWASALNSINMALTGWQ